MIEIQARLLRGPVYFGSETIQCLVTLRHVPANGDQPANISSAKLNGHDAELVENHHSR